MLHEWMVQSCALIRYARKEKITSKLTRSGVDRRGVWVETVENTNVSSRRKFSKFKKQEQGLRREQL
jgi:hypothetical protein